MRGEVQPARFHLPPPAVGVRAIRTRLGLRQAAVREWEQGRRRPERAARTLPPVIARDMGKAPFCPSRP